MSDVDIVVTRSTGADGAVLVFIDTDFEPDGSDGPALRIMLNDGVVFEGVPLDHDGSDQERSAQEVRFGIDLPEIAYVDDRIEGRGDELDELAELEGNVSDE